ncbi:hypothetical protein AALA44_01105 [Enterococcus ratti]|uniref:hypothetical protein n=1 Tax=Enterococcus ratti TaxID=150033 RepID=UPI003514F4E2
MKKKQILTLSLLISAGLYLFNPTAHATTHLDNSIINRSSLRSIIELEVEGWQWYRKPKVTYDTTTDKFHVESYVVGLNPGGHKSTYKILAVMNTGEKITITNKTINGTWDEAPLFFDFSLPSDVRKEKVSYLEYHLKTTDDLWHETLNGYAKISSESLFGCPN